MAEIGDVATEWHKLPTWGKVAAGLAGAVVAWYVYQAYVNNAANTAATATTTTASGTQSPFASVGPSSLPLLPNNVNPIYDSSGNPVAFQQGPTAPTPAPNTTPGPLIPTGSLPPGFNNKLGSQFNYGGVNYSIIPGSQGRIWGVPGTGFTTSQLQNFPIQPGGKTLIYQGDIGGSVKKSTMASLMSDPNVYFSALVPHISSAVPQEAVAQEAALEKAHKAPSGYGGQTVSSPSQSGPFSHRN